MLKLDEKLSMWKGKGNDLGFWMPWLSVLVREGRQRGDMRGVEDR
jgi:hypothetical protein